MPPAHDPSMHGRDFHGPPQPQAGAPQPMMHHSPQRMQKSPQKSHHHESARLPSQYDSPHRMQKSPQRSHKSPNRLQKESFNQDDLMDAMSGESVPINQEYVSPRKVAPKDSHDGYDSPERKNTDSRHHSYNGPDEQPPRRKSLSERILDYKRKHTEEFESGLNDHRTKTISKSADRPDNGEDEFGHSERMKRKKSLQERVAEFKERRKNSQGFGLGGMSDASSRRSLSKKS